IVLVSLCLCLLASAINAEKQHKHQGKLSKSGHEEHKKEADVAVEPVQNDEEVADVKTPTAAAANEQTPVAKTAESGRKHRNNHHGKNKKRSKSEHNSDSHTGRSRKSQTKTNKHNGQRS
ncbi:hypothetical protein DOY81_009884, partial [Sarcophaga bullata]